MKKPYLITTEKRGVFMAYIDPSQYEVDKRAIDVEDIRMCVYWSQDVKGVIGLAATGPTKACKITKAAKKGRIEFVTAILEITKEAEKAWEKEPWNS